MAGTVSGAKWQQSGSPIRDVELHAVDKRVVGNRAGVSSAPAQRLQAVFTGETHVR